MVAVLLAAALSLVLAIASAIPWYRGTLRPWVRSRARAVCRALRDGDCDGLTSAEREAISELIDAHAAGLGRERSDLLRDNANLARAVGKLEAR